MHLQSLTSKARIRTQQSPSTLVLSILIHSQSTPSPDEDQQYSGRFVAINTYRETHDSSEHAPVKLGKEIQALVLSAEIYAGNVATGLACFSRLIKI